MAGSEGRRLTAADVVIGASMTAAAVLHAAAHVRAGRYQDVFWICDVASLLLGPGVLLRSPMIAAVGLTWLLPGTVVWIVDALVAGSAVMPTSYAVHLGGAAASVYAVRRNGHAPNGWIAAIAVLLGAVIVSRLALPPHANINAAHAVPRGWGFLAAGPPHAERAVFVVVAALLVILCAMGGRALGRAVGGASLRRTS
jgi:hypothetical protein